MSQISPPIRILVLAVIGLLAAWMLFLKPKEEAAPAPAPAAATAPGVDGLGKAVDAAEGAATAQEGRDARVQEATGETTKAETRAATKAARERAAGKVAKLEAGDLPRPVARAVAKQKVLVLLFWNPKSADDRAVKRAVRKVDRWDGRVFVHSAPITSISKFGPIARGADVDQSPTVVVVDQELKADLLVGFADTQTIDQAVVDAFRNSGVLIKDPYLSAVNQNCAAQGSLSRAVVIPDQPSQVAPYLDDIRKGGRRMSRRFAAIKAPARWRSFKRATVADHAAYAALLTDIVAYLGTKPSGPRVVSALQRFVPRETALVKRYDRRMDAENLLSCGKNA